MKRVDQGEILRVLKYALLCLYADFSYIFFFVFRTCHEREGADDDSDLPIAAELYGSRIDAENGNL